MAGRFGFLLAIAIVSIAGVAIAAGGGGSDALTLCAKKRGGALRFAANGKCAGNERKLTVARTGPAGVPGPVGPAGTPGPAGATGPAGADGADGSTGATGAQGAQGSAGATGATGAAGAQGPTGPAGKDGTPAELQPEAVHLVTTVDAIPPASRPECETNPGVFCSNDEVRWTNYGEGYAAVGYQKDASGYVHLSGSAREKLGSGFERREIFYLPPGYRPQATRHFAVATCGGLAPESFVYVDVEPSGAVVTEFNYYCVSLDGIAFYP